MIYVYTPKHRTSFLRLKPRLLLEVQQGGGGGGWGVVGGVGAGGGGGRERKRERERELLGGETLRPSP
jgi:hypothetical protein